MSRLRYCWFVAGVAVSAALDWPLTGPVPWARMAVYFALAVLIAWAGELDHAERRAS